MTTRRLERVIPSIPASDGAGVKLRRSLGASQLARHDPFLMLDEFFSDDPDDYLAGFPSHPHRGFETVTYMLDGHMQHKDDHGNTGDLGPGDVQWMTRGARHHPFRDAAADRRPHARLPALAQPAGEGKDEAGGLPRHRRERDSRGFKPDGVQVKVIAGALEGRRPSDRSTAAAPTRTTSTCISRRARCSNAALPAGHNAFLYVYEGEALVGDESEAAARIARQDCFPTAIGRIEAGPSGARVLLLAGKPLREPVVQYGPFVMNTREEIEQAIADYQAGTLSRGEIGRIKIA